MNGSVWFALLACTFAIAVWSWAIWDLQRKRKGQRPALNCRRNRLGAWLANKSLRLTTPEYRAFIRGSIEYGMRAAKRDNDEGREPPDDWRPALPGSDPYPVVERLS